MIKIEHIEVFNLEGAVRGARNPMNSWSKSDSYWDFPEYPDRYVIGHNDMNLLRRLVFAGADHRKFLRQIMVTVDITAPLYWWKEFDTYKVGTVANSCSTMHKIHATEFTPDDFSHDRISGEYLESLNLTIGVLNLARRRFIETNSREHWDAIIQLLPSSYNQRRTITLNYEVLLNIYHARRNHKLSEWRDFCSIIESLPYFREICLTPPEVADAG